MTNNIIRAVLSIIGLVAFLWACVALLNGQFEKATAWFLLDISLTITCVILRMDKDRSER